MYHILYVDDEKTLLEIAQLFLETGGEFSVDTVTSAGEALVLLQKKSYDAIISDYQMPGMDGIGFLKEVRGSGSSIPFILFTGRGREEIVIQALNEGADFYLQKGGDPVPQFAELAHKVRLAIQQKRAEASIRDHERREQEIINFLPDATLAIDTNGAVIAWNRRIEEMTGVPASQMLGKGNYEYALPFYGERRPILIDLILSPEEDVRTHYTGIVRDGTTLAAETTFPRVKGKPRTLWGKASLLYDRSGRVSGAIEAIRDITDRKAVEAELIRVRDVLEDRVSQRTADLYASNMQLQREIETRKIIDSALKESEERFRILIEEAPEAILLYDTDQDRNIIANAQAEKLFGCSREDLLRSGFERFYLPDQADGKDTGTSFAAHRQQVMNGENLVFERRIRTAGGEERLTEVRLVSLPPPFRRLVRVSFTDITELRRNEERYREIMEKDYRSILENMQDVFYRTNAAGSIILVSPSSLRLLGYASVDEILGRPANDFYADPAERDTFLASLMKNGTVESFEVTLKRKDGSPVRVSTSSHLWFDSSGQVAGVEGTIRDISRFREVQAALKESEEKYRVLVAHIQDGAFISQDGILLFANDAFASMMGYTSDQVTGRPVPDLIAPEDREMVMTRQRARLAGETLQETYGFNLLHRDGKTRIPVLMSVGIGTYRSRPAVIGTMRNITGQLQKEEELRESEERLRQITETLAGVFYIHDRALNRFIYVSPGYEKIWKRSCQSLIDDPFTFLQAVHPEDLPRLEEAMRRELEEGVYVDTEYRIVHPDGSMRWIHSRNFPIHDSRGQVYRVAGTAEDITERKKGEEALGESERRYRTLAEASRDLIFVIGADDRVEYVNSYAAGILHFPAEEVIGMERSRLFAGDVGERQGKALQQVFATGRAVHSQGSMDIGGARRWFDHFLMPIADADGSITSVLGVSRDITPLKDAEQALREANRKLGLLSSVTRHDVINHLMALKGFTALAKSRCSDEKFLNYSGRQAEIITRIEQEILFTREYQEIGVKAPVWQNAGESIRSAVSTTDLHGITLAIDLPEGLEIYADPLLPKVFFNLVENALRHGGDRLTGIRFSSRDEKGDLLIVCEDNGAGVPEEEKEIIFERGYGKHTGFGLFLIREILSITGLTITENGEPGRCARFGIRVPRGAYRLTPSS